MNILVFGGTGVMGSNLCQILADSGHFVYTTSRSKRQDRTRITFIKGNAHDISFTKTLLQKKKWDVIVDFMKYSTEEFKGRVSILLDSTNIYIYLSSARVFAESQTPLTEDSTKLIDVCKDKDYLATDEYALAKCRQENILKCCKKHNWAIIRPYVTFGETRLQLSALEKEYWLYRALKGRTIVFSKDLAEKITTFTYGHDVATTIAAIAEGGESCFGQEYNVTTKEPHSWEEILDTYLSVLKGHLGMQPQVLFLPKWEQFMGGNKCQVKWDRLYNRYFDNTKISHYTDTSNYHDTISALSLCLGEFLKKPHFKKINWASEAMKDRLTGEWAEFWEIEGILQKLKYYIIRLGLYTKYENKKLK